MKYQAITISGPICSGKSTLFKNLCQKLNWPSYSASQFFRDFCQKHSLPLFAAQLRPESLTREIDKGVREKLLREKEIIIEGWLAGFMGQGISGVLKILLICADEERFRRFSQREGISLEKARQKIEKQESNLFTKWKKVYGQDDFLEQRYYDLVIDTTDLKPKEVIDLVLARLED